MIEEALKKSNEPPSETARALLSFFRQEFPHGGEYRFIQFFPLLLDRAFGPVLHDALLKEREFSSEELKMMESAWLMQSRAWRRSMTSSSSQGGNMNMGMHNSASSSSSRLDQDPVVQLLGSPLISQSIRSTTSSLTSKATLGSRGMGSPTPSASPVKTVSFFQLLNCCIDHPLSSNIQDEIIDAEYSFDLQVIPKARSSYPFSELPESLQGKTLDIVYTSPSAQSQFATKLTNISAFMRDLAPLAQVKPNVLDALNERELFEKYARYRNVSPTIIKSEEDINAVREQRAQQEQMLNQAKVAPAMGTAMKDIAQAKSVDPEGIGDILGI